MMHKHSTILSLLTMLLLSTAAFAQNGGDTQDPENLEISQFQGGIGLLISTPQGAYKDNTDQVGVGLTLDLGYVLPELPVVIGGTFAWATYGSETSNVPFSNTVGNLVRVDVTTSNNLVLGHAFLRLQPQQGMFRPYAEGLLGFNYLYTETSVEGEWSEESIATSTNLDDFVFSYGGGAGLMFRVYRGETDMPGQGMEVLVNLGVRYLLGGEAKYYDSNSLTKDANGAPALNEEDALQSKTDMLNFTLGVSVRL